MKNKLIGFFSLLALVGCGGISISPRGCKTEANLANDKVALDASSSIDVKSFLNQENIYYRDIVDCERLGDFRLKIKKTLFFYYHVTLDFKEE